MAFPFARCQSCGWGGAFNGSLLVRSQGFGWCRCCSSGLWSGSEERQLWRALGELLTSVTGMVSVGAIRGAS